VSKLEYLQVGNFVVITKCLDEEAYAPRRKSSPWPFVEDGDEREPIKYDGKPYRIIEIGLPFICVTDGQRVFALDSRAWQFQKVSTLYAQAMTAAHCETAHEKQQRSTLLLGGQQTQSLDVRACPKCGNRMIEQSVAGRPGWFIVCKDCGHNGGPVIAVIP